MRDVTDANNNEESCCSEDPEDENILVRRGLLPFRPQRCGHACNGHCLPHTPVENAINSYYKLVRLLQKGALCDAILKTQDGGIFHVHRLVLMAESDYFRALFTTSLHKRHESKVLIHNVRSGLLKYLLHYMYTRKAWLSDEIVIPVLEAADYLGIVSLRAACMKFIQKQISPQNVLGIRQDHFCLELRNSAHNYLMINFAEVTKESQELLDLTLKELLSIFEDDDLNVKNEEVVWEAAIRWIDFDPEERKKCMTDLMKKMRTGLMETQYFMEHVKDHPYVTSAEGCRILVIETLRFLLQFTQPASPLFANEPEKLTNPEIAKPRIPHEILFAIGGWSGGSPTSFVETYDTRADRWVRVPEVDPTGPRAYHGTVAIGFEIFVIGGFDGNEYFSTCRAFHAVTKKWRSVAAMHCKRCYVSIALIDNDKIFAMGGYDGQHRQNTCERYNSTKNQWTNVAPMHFQRSDASATSINNKVYICGGFNGVECLSSCECYDPQIDQWTMIAPMRNRRSGVSCVAYHKHIYVVGGFNGITRMCSGEKYNPDTNAWTPIPDMYTSRSNFAIEVIDDLLFCIGGFTGTSTTFNVECYDDKSNEWYEATDMNIYRSALAACVVSGLPNMHDYIHKQRDRLMEERRQRMLNASPQTNTVIAQAV